MSNAVPRQRVSGFNANLDLVLELLTLEQALGLLGLSFSIVAGSRLLRLCRDLDGLLDRCRKSLSRPLVNGLYRLNVDIGDDELVAGKCKLECGWATSQRCCGANQDARRLTNRG